MSVLNQEVTESSSGFKKEIDEGGLSLLLDTVQIYIYQFPIKSSTRESVSNAIDSITERNIAKILLADPSKIGEYYVEREGEIYKDSRFDPSYYNPKYLSTDDTVYITYQKTDSSQLRDRITIKDNGVGLGDNRLEGYMKISYSSKRLSTKTLGTFGLGCKSPLATGVDNYSLKTAHNGKEFSFLIYKDKIDNCYSKWNQDGTMNDYITFTNGYKVYYKKTTKHNFVEVSWDVKKHQAEEYKNAIRSQLLYFKNPIDFRIKNGWGSDERVDFQAKIIHETEDYILADQNYFSRPHLIINGVCYGFVEFKELELDQKYGHIGLKINMEDVTVTPSRESCVWDTKTKDAILKKYEALATSSEKLINETLSKLDFIEWLKACYSISNLNSGETKEMKIISQLASLTGFSSLKVQYKDTGIKFNSALDKMIESGLIDFTRVYVYSGYDSSKRSYVNSLKYSSNANESQLFSGRDAYLQYGGSDLFRSVIGCKARTGDLNEIVLIRAKARAGDDYKDAMTKLIKKEVTLTEALALIDGFEVVKSIEDIPKRKEKALEYIKAFEFINMLVLQKTKVYDEIVIPPGYKTDLQETIDNVAVVTTTDDTTGAVVVQKTDWNALRKLTGKIVVQYPRIDYNTTIVNSKTEVKPSDLVDCTDTIVYGTRDELELLNFLYVVSRSNKNTHDSYNKAFTDNPRVCIVSKAVEKHFRPFTGVEEYLFGTDGKTICEPLKKIFTAKVLQDWFKSSHSYFKKLAEFSPSITATYAEISEYISDHNRPYGFHKYLELLPKDKKEFLEKSTKIQTILLEKGGDIALAFQTDKYPDEDYMAVPIFDETMLEKAKWLLDFDKVFGALFSEIDSLKNYNKTITPELAMEIKEIIDARKDRLAQDFPDLCC